MRWIGYWRNESLKDFPHPKDLVNPGWLDEEELVLLVEYLKSGKTFIQWKGLSYCRFQCGISVSKMGSKCKTDGDWVWPEGLFHYVQEHDVMLPEEFVSHCRERSWQLKERLTETWLGWEPEPFPEPGKNDRPEKRGKYWIEWAQEATRQLAENKPA